MGKSKMPQEVLDSLRRSVLRADIPLREKMVLQELKRQWDNCGDHDPSGVSVAEAVGLGVSVTYEVLKVLAKRGSVKAVGTNPARYYPAEYYEEVMKGFE